MLKNIQNNIFFLQFSEINYSYIGIYLVSHFTYQAKKEMMPLEQLFFCIFHRKQFLCKK